MIKAVIDTNVWISALLGTGSPKKVLDRLKDKHFQPICSAQLFDELLDVLSRPKFAGKITDVDAAELLRTVRLAATFVTTQPVPPLSRDPDDDALLACAVAAGATYIVTGDDDLLCLGEHAGIKLVNASTFLAILGAAG